MSAVQVLPFLETETVHAPSGKLTAPPEDEESKRETERTCWEQLSVRRKTISLLTRASELCPELIEVKIKVDARATATTMTMRTVVVAIIPG